MVFCLPVIHCAAQSDTNQKKPQYKNVVRYNLSGGIVFGIDRYIVFGYERVIRPNQSISVNFGTVKLPKVISINTDSFSLKKDKKSNGTNFSIDYRFYLGKENKYAAPRGVYIGPYYSYNHFTRDNEWDFTNSSTGSFVDSHSTFNIHAVGFEFGYQLILWKRFSIDMVLVGPGLGFYNYKVNFESNLSAEDKQQLLDGMQQLLTQKFPGMNFVFADKQISGNGVMKTSTIGYRYIFHIGFVF